MQLNKKTLRKHKHKKTTINPPPRNANQIKLKIFKISTQTYKISNCLFNF